VPAQRDVPPLRYTVQPGHANFNGCGCYEELLLRLARGVQHGEVSCGCSQHFKLRDLQCLGRIDGQG
jgi:hypothetical protein